MKIIHIIPNLCKGGAERLCLDICLELISRENVSVLIITLENSNHFQHETESLNIRSVPKELKISIIKANSTDLPKFNDIVQEFNPHIIHTHLYLSELYGSTIKSNAVRFCHLHSNYEEFQKKSLLTCKSKKDLTELYEYKYYLSKIKSNPPNYLCVSNNTLMFAKKELGRFSQNIYLSHNAIKTSNFPSTTHPCLDEIKLVTIGTLKKEKGIDFLIQAVFELIQLTDRNVEFNIIGDGVEKNNLLSICEKLNLSNIIKFVGSSDFPQIYLEQSNLYIHGTISEAFGLTLIEAMSTGLPVISTDGKGNRDFMDRSNGILLKHRDPKRFAQEILSLIEDKERYMKLQKGALETAAKYDIKPYVDRLLELYQKAIDEQ